MEVGAQVGRWSLERAVVFREIAHSESADFCAHCIVVHVGAAHVAVFLSNGVLEAVGEIDCIVDDEIASGD